MSTSWMKVSSSLSIFGESAVTVRGKLLIATGGMLKPKKCFYYVVEYEWQYDGSGVYSEMIDCMRGPPSCDMGHISPFSFIFRPVDIEHYSSLWGIMPECHVEYPISSFLYINGT